MKSFAIPTPAQIDAAVQRMRSPDFAAYFLSRLANPNWVGPLAQSGLFSSPPPPITFEQGAISYPHWPASEYLARMAKHVPSEVATLLSKIRTENGSVVGDMIEAALAMPAAEAALLTPAVGDAARVGTLWIHFKDASDLCVHLAKGGEVRAALALANALFAPRTGEGEEHLSRRDGYWYNEGLKRIVPVLAELEPQQFAHQMRGWLDALVRLKEHVRIDSGDDYSYWWRPAIEEHDQNRDYDLAGALVGFLRHALELAVSNGGMSLAQAHEILDDSPFLIFKRIRLHLINEFAEHDPHLARQAMMDRDLFDDFRYKHEYAMLVGRRLDLVTADERKTWFEWVDAGPDMSHFDTSIREAHGREATDEDRENRKKYWQFEKLHCVRAHLDGERRGFYEDMLSEYGVPDLADLNSRVSTGCGGGGSAITIDELSTLTFGRAVERVSAWAPQSGRFMGPDFEGLASAFGEFVGTNPSVFSAEAATLTRRPALYVRTFISQMTEAIRSGRNIDVPAVIGLCRWVVDRPREERAGPEEGPGELIDKDWQWTRDAIARFLQAIFQAKTEEAPTYPMESLREPMWQIVHALARDPSRSYIVQDTSKADPRGHDYLTLGINSPRGKAVEAALDYARWVAKQVQMVDGDREVVPGGFSAMPEVREMLEWQMAAENRSVEAMALIGSRLGLIFWIDRDWLAANARRLFHLEGIEDSPPSTQGWAAWNAFLVWVQPHVEYYRVFREQYAYAVRQSTTTELGEPSHERPMDHLGEHLMVLYGRGQLRLDDDDGLLSGFLANANPAIRRSAIGFVGQLLNREGDLPQDFVDRYQRLWEVYWAGRGRTDTEQEPDAWAFGMWFSSGRFPPEWAISRLHEFVEIAPIPEPDHQVLEELARVAPTDILKALDILRRMVHADREGWHVGIWLGAASRILELAMRAGGAARMTAERLIDQLGRRGYSSVGDLLGLSEGAD